ncbi:hypothetical protein [Priestia taiwanensis]|uniref:Uncharacterized protein n=1 Tax=Priestia taiwanensis TaxID=1347902 RepID=A0A917ES01_9BACI|nr:hypothetical protein [Priestia taiwanensis]MBM7364790.1 FlaA1/EpsC-like NDP-sugar epimerase [Priestia taiwanensis]GGE79671.1 hypothetical protein GCM10007140_31550 [Priestia taiwanensis]
MQKTWWFIRGSLIEIGNIFILLIISYLSIIINIFIIFGIDSVKLGDIVKRQDIVNMILTTGISMLAGILVLELSKAKIRKGTLFSILGNCLLASILSLILTIQIEKKEVFFNLNIVYFMTTLFFVITLLIVFRTNYSFKNVKEYIRIQQTAKNSRDKNKFKIDDAEYKV